MLSRSDLDAWDERALREGGLPCAQSRLLIKEVRRLQQFEQVGIDRGRFELWQELLAPPLALDARLHQESKDHRG